jgi:predicted metal-binding membrane protein
VRSEIFKHHAIHAHPYAAESELIAAGAYRFPTLVDISCLRQCRFEFVETDLGVNASPNLSP